MNTPGPLGWIEPKDRTPAVWAAHARATAMMARFADSALPLPTGPVRVLLTEAFKARQVVADVGLTFQRFRQLTGSCVGAGGGSALFTLIAVQRLLATHPTKAFIPWWPFDYGRSRFRLGDTRPGEGSLGSMFAEAVTKDGVMSAAEPGLPTFDSADGLAITERQEMEWSDGDSPSVMKWLDTAKQHPLGTAAEMSRPLDMKAAVINGYPGTFACDRFIGNARVQGSGANARVVGKWDGNGGHQQWFAGYEDNPELGPLYAIGNNWARETYPMDPGGLPPCCCWVKEADVAAAFRYHAEVYAFSHLSWFPAQPEMVSWADILPRA